LSATFLILWSWHLWIAGRSKTRSTAARNCVAALDADEDRAAGVQAAFTQPGQQIGDDRGVLGGTFGQPGRVFGAADPDAQRDHAQVLADVHAMISNATRSRPDRSAVSSSASAASAAATKRREIADLLVERAVCSTRAPTGSSPTG